MQLEKKLGTEMEMGMGMGMGMARRREGDKSACSHLPEGLPLFLPHYWMTGCGKEEGPLCHWKRGGALAPIREGRDCIWQFVRSVRREDI